MHTPSHSSHTHTTLTPPPSQLPDKHGITAILAAIYEGHEDCVKLLVDKVTSWSMRGTFCVRTLFCGALKTQLSNDMSIMFNVQGASRNGKAPDGSSYIDCAESEEIKALLR